MKKNHPVMSRYRIIGLYIQERSSRDEPKISSPATNQRLSSTRVSLLTIGSGRASVPISAWAVEDLEQDIGLIYRSMGMKGVQSIPDVTLPIARVIETLLPAE